MPVNNERKNYIEKLYSVTKEAPFVPWKVEYPNPLDNGKKLVVYLENFYNKSGSFLNSIEVVKVGEDFEYILSELFPTITSYPYAWPLEGQKIDNNGYDFYSDFQEDGASRILEVTDSARVIAWEKLNIYSPKGQLEYELTKDEFVEGKHLAKMQITLAKAGPVSEIALNLHTIKNAELLSIVYEQDIVKYSNPKKINLNELGVVPSSEIFLIKFGKPIFAKRITFVLAQNNSDFNTYAIKDITSNNEKMLYETKKVEHNPEIDSLYQLLSNDKKNMDLSNINKIQKEFLKDQQNLNSFDIYKTNEIFSDEDIKDWSADRKIAYLQWREKAISYKNIKGDN